MDTDEGKRPGSLNNRVPYQDFTFPVTALTRSERSLAVLSRKCLSVSHMQVNGPCGNCILRYQRSGTAGPFLVGAPHH